MALTQWGSAGEDCFFPLETRKLLAKTGISISPHILRHTFAINYLIKSNDSFSFQKLLEHEDLITKLNYIHMNDTILQEQKRKYSPGDHIPIQIQEQKEKRRTGFKPKARGKRAGG